MSKKKSRNCLGSYSHKYSTERRCTTGKLRASIGCAACVRMCSVGTESKEPPGAILHSRLLLALGAPPVGPTEVLCPKAGAWGQQELSLPREDPR